MKKRTRNLAIGAAVLTYAGLGFVGAKYIAGGLFVLANRQLPIGVTASTWSQNWEAYADDAKQRTRLKMSAAIGGGLVFGLPPLLAAKLLSQERSLHGDARFANGAEIRRSGLYAENGLLIGQVGSRYLTFGGQQFVYVAAPTRSRKGVAIVIPNLLHWPGSAVVQDIKEENFRITSRFRAQNGQRVFMFNPFAENGQTHRWNVLDGVRREAHLRVGDVMAIARVIYPTDDPKAKFWNEQAANLFLGLALYLLDTPALPCSIGEMLRQASGKGQSLLDHLQAIMAARAVDGPPLSDECLDALRRFCSVPDRTMGDVLATFTAPLTIFANPLVDAATSASDFDLGRVRKEPMTIYLCITPDRLEDAPLLVNLVYSQLIVQNTRVLPANDPELKHACLLLLDEATAPGKINILPKSVGYLAGYDLRLLTIMQSVAQCQGVYGDNDTRTLVTNHAAQVIFPPKEQKDAKEYSEMLGYFTERAVAKSVTWPRTWGGSGGTTSENASDQRRALMLPQELREMPQDEEIIILENTKPIRCKKICYYADPVFVDRLKSVSPTLAALGKALPTKEQLEHAAYVVRDLSAEVPVVDFKAHRAKATSAVRPLREDEAIDLARLAIDVAALPTLGDTEEPSAEAVAAVVDAYMRQLGWQDAQASGIKSEAAGTPAHEDATTERAH